MQHPNFHPIAPDQYEICLCQLSSLWVKEPLETRKCIHQETSKSMPTSLIESGRSVPSVQPASSNKGTHQLGWRSPSRGRNERIHHVLGWPTGGTQSKRLILIGSRINQSNLPSQTVGSSLFQLYANKLKHADYVDAYAFMVKKIMPIVRV
jgi:hypothetical protein